MNIDAPWVLAPDRKAPRAARRCVERWAVQRGVDSEDSHSLLLVTSEMVTNAVTHAAGPVGLSVHAGPDTVTVRVTDAGHRDLQRPPRQPGSTGGRGLSIVRALSLAWGVNRRPGGKTVWARPSLS